MKRLALKLSAVCAALCAVSAATANITVTDGGVASYSIPIAVPPGVAGMEPRLAIQHSSSGVNGPLGIGWSISGISIIGRCAPLKATDGDSGGVAYSPSDKLCLNGERLFSVSAPGAPITGPTQDAAGVATGFVEYRTEKDSFARIRAYGIANGSASNGPAYFKLWTKDGQVFEFGNTEDSRIEAQGSGVVMVWAVSRISDTISTTDANRNSVLFSYEERSVAWGSGPVSGPLPGKEWNLSRITYTSRGTSTGANRVDFAYVDRTLGQAETYHLGAKNVSVRLLSEIRTFVNQQPTDPRPNEPSSPSANPIPTSNSIPVAVYKLQYEYSSAEATRRPRLTSVRQCAGRNPAVCLPGHELAYWNTVAGTFMSDAGFNLGPVQLYNRWGDFRVVTGDFDGDGRTDLLRLGYFGSSNTNPAASPQYWNRLYFSRPRAVSDAYSASSAVAIEFVEAANLNISAERLEGCNYAATDPAASLSNGIYIADLNGDGLDDILMISSGPGRYCPTAGTRVYWSRGDGTFQSQVITSLPLADYHTFVESTGGENPMRGFLAGETFMLADFNADGLPDVLTVSAAERSGNPGVGDLVYVNRLYRNDGNGSFTLLSAPPVSGDQSWGSDVSGQPLYMADYSYGEIGARRLPSGKSRSSFIDLNADGKADIIRAPGGPITVRNYDASAGGDSSPPPFVPRAAPSAFLSQSSAGWAASDTIPAGCRRLAWVDVNGDQKLDILCLGYTALELVQSGDSSPTYQSVNYPPTLHIGMGNGQFFQSPAFVAHMNPASGRYYVTEDAAVPVDVNGDGQTDIVAISDVPGDTKIWLSNGDGSFREISNSLGQYPLRLGGQAAARVSYVTGMFSGRGQMEFLRLGDHSEGYGNLLITKSSTQPADALISAKTPTGASSAVAYRYLSDGLQPSIHETLRGTSEATTFPVIDLQLPVPVVSTLLLDGGVGASGAGQRILAQRFRYRGLKAEAAGRGMLGFRYSAREWQGPNGDWLTTESWYRQSFPLVGIAERVATRRGRIDGTGNLLTEKIYLYCDTATRLSADCPETATAGPGRLLRRPYVRQTREGGFDLDNPSIQLPRITTTNAYDKTYGDTGDIKQIIVETVGLVAGVERTFTKTTNNVYRAPNTSGDNWALGRLERSSVTSAAPDIRLSTGPGASPNAASVDGLDANNIPPTVGISIASN